MAPKIHCGGPGACAIFRSKRSGLKCAKLQGSRVAAEGSMGAATRGGAGPAVSAPLSTDVDNRVCKFCLGCAVFFVGLWRCSPSSATGEPRTNHDALAALWGDRGAARHPRAAGRHPRQTASVFTVEVALGRCEPTGRSKTTAACGQALLLFSTGVTRLVVLLLVSEIIYRRRGSVLTTL